MRQLLWKDYRQAWPALLGCWVISLLLILGGYLQQFSSPTPSAILISCIWFALIAPTLAAMACSGLLIGHERQSRAWNWSSSMPIHWSSALASKTLVWVTSSLVMLLSLLAIFGGLLQLSVWQNLVSSTESDWPSPYLIVMVAVIVPLEVYVCFTLAALLFQETLSALVLAGIVVAVGHFALADLVPRLIWSIPHAGLALDPPGVAGMLLVLAAVVGVGSMGAARVFQWRWTIGQHHTWRSWSRSAAESGLVQPLLWQSYHLRMRQPSQGQMLLWHGALSSLGLRGLVVLIALLTLGINTDRDFPTIPVLMLSAGLLGLSVFAGDQTQSRFRFLADRGVEWRKLLAAHVSVPLLMLVGIWMLFWCTGKLDNQFVDGYRHVAMVASLLAIFNVAILCSLCVPSALLAACVLALIVVATGIWISTVVEFWNQLSLLAIVPWFQVLVALIGIPWFTTIFLRRWLVGQRPPGLQILLGAWFCLVVVPGLFDLHTAFLTQPNTPWPGVAASEIKVSSNQTGIEIRVPREAYIEHTWGPMGIQYHHQVAQSLDRHTAQPAHRNGQSAESIRLAIKRINNVLDQQPAEAVLKANQDELINQSALWALYAMQTLKDRELSIAAWRVNKRLGAMIDFSALESVALMRARLNSDIIRSELTNDQWTWLRESSDLAVLIHTPVPTEELKRFARMAAGTVLQAAQWNTQPGWTLPFNSSWQFAYGSVAQIYARPRTVWHWYMLKYPPVGWLFQRQLSSILHGELEMFSSTGYQATWDANAYVIPQYTVVVGLHHIERSLAEFTQRFKPEGDSTVE